jgi:hypothetical protein
MKDELKKNVLSVCELLHRFDVRYMLVGGAAVALHGYYRHSMGPDGKPALKLDIDVWFDPSYENYFKLLKVLEALGEEISEIKNEQQPDPKRSFFRVELEEFTLDVIPVIRADIRFSDAYTRKEEVELEGIPIHYIGYLDLLEDKKATARKKDIDDIEQLKMGNGGEA